MDVSMWTVCFLAVTTLSGSCSPIETDESRTSGSFGEFLNHSNGSSTTKELITSEGDGESAAQHDQRNMFYSVPKGTDKPSSSDGTNTDTTQVPHEKTISPNEKPFGPDITQSSSVGRADRGRVQILDGESSQENSQVHVKRRSSDKTGLYVDDYDEENDNNDDDDDDDDDGDGDDNFEEK